MIGPIEFIREVLVDPETGQPFVLYPAQERFLREALTPGPDGRLPYAELVYSGPKKSGKMTSTGRAPSRRTIPEILASAFLTSCQPGLSSA